ncbi:MAG: aminodeoxychorismate lyase [Candidatus Campbellbacteria bacterium]
MRRRHLLFAALSALILFITLLHTPRDFASPTLSTVAKGASFSEIAQQLEVENVITSPLLLRVLVTLFGGTTSVQAGDYLFEKQQGTLRVAWRLTHGAFGLASVRVVLPEGLTVVQMGETVREALPHFDTEKFERLASGREGYLFPDTYFFMVNATPETVVDVLTMRFDAVLEELSGELASSSRSIPDVVTMASILEEEAKTPEDKRIVAGILWKRIDIGMALQVDATFKYTLGKASHELTADDLATDTPYNTYTRTGLPPTPISNPGLESLRAALDPTATEYFYYLTGNDGRMYYAEDFEGHKQNKAKHL